MPYLLFGGFPDCIKLRTTEAYGPRTFYPVAVPLHKLWEWQWLVKSWDVSMTYSRSPGLKLDDTHCHNYENGEWVQYDFDIFFSASGSKSETIARGLYGCPASWLPYFTPGGSWQCYAVPTVPCWSDKSGDFSTGSQFNLKFLHAFYYGAADYSILKVDDDYYPSFWFWSEVWAAARPCSTQKVECDSAHETDPQCGILTIDDIVIPLYGPATDSFNVTITRNELWP